ncbi:Or9e93 [Eciton burchellii]|nr:Or9e93 [Eciton burchellii]
MICIESRFFHINRILLHVLGLWPYKQSKFTQLQSALYYTILTSFIAAQFAVFITSKCTPQIVIEILSTIFFFSICILKYNSYHSNLDAVKYLLELLQYTYDELKDKSEIAIIEKYWTIAKRNTKIFTLMLFCGILVCGCNTLLPCILRVSLPINESRPVLSLHIMTEYFIDQEKYFYLLVMHKEIASCIGVTAIVATGTMNMLYLQHACGMFIIASYRIKQAMMSINLQKNNKENKNFVYMKIIYGIDMHRKAMRYVKLLMSSFNVHYFFLIANIVISASLISVRIYKGLISGCNFEKLVSPILFLISLYMYMFYANKSAQEIIDHNNHIFVTICTVDWYIAPLYIQKLMLFLLQKSSKTFNIVIGGLFVGSLQGFATLINTTISYFTIMYSTDR